MLLGCEGDGASVVQTVACSTGKRPIQQVSSLMPAQRRRVVGSVTCTGVVGSGSHLGPGVNSFEGAMPGAAAPAMSCGGQNPVDAAEANPTAPATVSCASPTGNSEVGHRGYVAALPGPIDRGVAPVPTAQKWSVPRFLKELVLGHGNIVVEGMPGG